MRTALWPKRSRHGRSRRPCPADRDEAEHRYQVVVYHHLENGMDEKLEYATPEEAEQAARGYLDGTMEADGFAYEGAAVYDLLEKKWLGVIGDFPTLELPAAKEGTEPKPPAAPMPTQEGTEKAAEYLFDQERIVVFQSPAANFITIMATMCRVGFPM